MKRIAMFALLVLLVGSFGATAATKPGRLPVIGCDDPRYPYPNHYGWSYAPGGYCGTRRGNGVEGIDRTKWRGWGTTRATGRGYVVVYDQSVQEFPATITALGLWATHHFLGGNEYFSAYTKLHVHVIARSVAGATWRGPVDRTLDVQIQE